MKSSEVKRIKVKTTIIVDMEINDGYTLEEAMDDLVVNIHNNSPSAYVYDNDLTYYEQISHD